MKSRNVIVPRYAETTEASLQRIAGHFRESGQITLTDPDGSKHLAHIQQVEVTPRGIEIEFDLPIIP